MMHYETGLLVDNRDFGKQIGLADPEKYPTGYRSVIDRQAPIYGLAAQDVREKKVGLPLLAVGIVIAVILIVFGRK